MSETAVDAKEKMLSEITAIITSLVPDISEKVKVDIKDTINRVFNNGIEAERKTLEKAMKEIIAEKEEVLDVIKKEMKEALSEIANKEKDAKTAFIDAAKDILAVIGSDPGKAAVVDTLVKIGENWNDIMEASKAIKNRQDITVNATKLVFAFISQAITILVCFVLIFGKGG